MVFEALFPVADEQIEPGSYIRVGAAGATYQVTRVEHGPSAHTLDWSRDATPGLLKMLSGQMFSLTIGTQIWMEPAHVHAIPWDANIFDMPLPTEVADR